MESGDEMDVGGGLRVEKNNERKWSSYRRRNTESETCGEVKWLLRFRNAFPKMESRAE